MVAIATGQLGAEWQKLAEWRNYRQVSTRQDVLKFSGKLGDLSCSFSAEELLHGKVGRNLGDIRRKVFRAQRAIIGFSLSVTPSLEGGPAY